MQSISLLNLVIRFKWRISLTFLLVILESILSILYPLFIGYAINDLLQNQYQGIIQLSVLGFLSLVVGTARRVYDTRVYSKIYSQIVPEMVETEHQKDSSVSKISARASLLTEFVEFLENSLPEVIGAIISLFGIIFIIATLNVNVFYACLGLLLLVFVIYLLTGELSFKLNAGYNSQLEMQVETLKSKDLNLIREHFSNLMKWNIKLSDLEAGNYFIIWVGIIALFAYTPITVLESGVLKYGMVFSILMYVFDYIDKVVTFPFYIQQLIRLKEISNRLSK